MTEFFEFEFIQRALLVGGLLSLVAATLGVFVVTRQLSFFSEAISHSALSGIALGILLHLDPFIAAIVFAVLIALGIVFVNERSKLASDTTIGVFLSFSVALGVLVIGLLKGFRAELFGFLFGDILAVTTSDIWISIVLAVIVLVFLFWRFKALTLISLSPDLAHVSGIKLRLFNYLFMALLAVTVAIAIKLIGVILVTALVIVPAAAAKNLGNNFLQMLIWALVISLFSVLVGIGASFYLDTASGPSIVIVSVIIFIASLFFVGGGKQVAR